VTHHFSELSINFSNSLASWYFTLLLFIVNSDLIEHLVLVFDVFEVVVAAVYTLLIVAHLQVAHRNIIIKSAVETFETTSSILLVNE
jgi:hypothetical protein